MGGKKKTYIRLLYQQIKPTIKLNQDTPDSNIIITVSGKKYLRNVDSNHAVINVRAEKHLDASMSYHKVSE